MTRGDLYAEMYDTRGLKASKSVYVVRMWLEFFGSYGAKDYDNMMVFSSKDAAYEYIDNCLLRWFGTTDLPYESVRNTFIPHYAIWCNSSDGVSCDYFPEEIAKQIKNVCYSIVCAPICKY